MLQSGCPGYTFVIAMNISVFTDVAVGFIIHEAKRFSPLAVRVAFDISYPLAQALGSQVFTSEAVLFCGYF